MPPCDSLCLPPARDLEREAGRGPLGHRIPVDGSYFPSLSASFFSLPYLSASCFCGNYFFKRKRKVQRITQSGSTYFQMHSVSLISTLPPSPAPAWGSHHSGLPRCGVAPCSLLPQPLTPTQHHRQSAVSSLPRALWRMGL